MKNLQHKKISANRLLAIILFVVKILYDTCFSFWINEQFYDINFILFENVGDILYLIIIVLFIWDFSCLYTKILFILGFLACLNNIIYVHTVILKSQYYFCANILFIILTIFSLYKLIQTYTNAKLFKI